MSIIEPGGRHAHVHALPVANEHIVALGTLARCRGCGRWFRHVDTFTGDWSPLSGWRPVRWWHRRDLRRIRYAPPAPDVHPGDHRDGPGQTITHWHENRGHKVESQVDDHAGRILARLCECGATLPPTTRRDPDGVCVAESWDPAEDAPPDAKR